MSGFEFSIISAIPECIGTEIVDATVKVLKL